MLYTIHFRDVIYFRRDYSSTPIKTYKTYDKLVFESESNLDFSAMINFFGINGVEWNVVNNEKKLDNDSNFTIEIIYHKNLQFSFKKEIIFTNNDLTLYNRDVKPVNNISALKYVRGKVRDIKENIKTFVFIDEIIIFKEMLMSQIKSGGSVNEKLIIEQIDNTLHMYSDMNKLKEFGDNISFNKKSVKFG